MQHGGDPGGKVQEAMAPRCRRQQHGAESLLTRLGLGKEQARGGKLGRNPPMHLPVSSNTTWPRWPPAPIPGSCAMLSLLIHLQPAASKRPGELKPSRGK